MSTLARHLQTRRVGGGGDQNTLTVLRVKRKRDQEPLDALVIRQQQRRVAKTRRTTGGASRSGTPSIYDVEDSPVMFALGETVTEADFGNAQMRAALQERLSMLQQSTKKPSNNDDDAMDTDDTPPVQPPQQIRNQPDRPTQFCVIGGRQVPLTDEIPPSAAAIGFELSHGIPQVFAAADLPTGTGTLRRIKMFDAITDEDVQTLRMAESKEPRASQPVSNAIDDELVPMVRDRLTFATTRSDYVYDLYYIPSSNNHPAHNSHQVPPNVGSVLWVDDLDELLDGGASDSDAGRYDEDDDSNAEDYYANDYPDDPDSSSGVYEYYYSSEEREELRAMEDNSHDDDVW
ncbi:hypothetical protein EV175_001074 [Coemansia sp. RSA 1933]|nr:hypothetical protein EV175_001074 [Coemansia sp. RSA 1933]